jgi:hypothetical protein
MPAIDLLWFALPVSWLVLVARDTLADRTPKDE